MPRWSRRASSSGTSNGTTNLTVTNRFGAGATLDTVYVEGALDDASGRITMLFPDDSGSTTLNGIPCNGYVTVHAYGNGVEIFLSREVIC